MGIIRRPEGGRCFHAIYFAHEILSSGRARVVSAFPQNVTINFTRIIAQNTREEPWNDTVKGVVISGTKYRFKNTQTCLNSCLLPRVIADTGIYSNKSKTRTNKKKHIFVYKSGIFFFLYKFNKKCLFWRADFYFESQVLFGRWLKF